MRSAVLTLFFGLTLAGAAQAEILFEAFYRVEKYGKHYGYGVQRVSADKSGNKTVITYLRSRAGDGEASISSKSVAKSGTLSPIETDHTYIEAGQTQKIMGKFAGGKGVVHFHSKKGRKPQSVEKISRGLFPSAFLFYVTEWSKMQTKTPYRYDAFAEEAGENRIGFLTVLGTQKAGNASFMHVLNDDSGAPVENFLSVRGEPLGSRSTANGVVAFWVPTKELAAADMAFPTGEMTSLFGDLPAGTKNPWSKVENFDARKVIKSFDEKLAKTKIKAARPWEQNFKALPVKNI